MGAVTVTPEAYRQFADRHRNFRLVVDERFSGEFVVPDSDAYADSRLVTASATATLAEVLTELVPDDTDVLVVATRTALAEAGDELIGPRRTVTVLRVAPDQSLGSATADLLRALERTDPEQQRTEAARLGAALRSPGGLTLTDDLTGVTAVLGGDPETVLGGDFGVFRPSALQVAPNGWVTVTAAPRAEAGLPLTGQVALKGRPLVRSRAGAGAERQAGYERLLPLLRYPLVLTLVDGVVTDLKAVDGGSESAAHTLSDLFEGNSGYRRISAVGFGVNPAVPELRANGETNRARANENGMTVHLVLGSLPGTELELVLPLDSSRIESGDGEVLAPGSGRTTDEPETCAIPPRRSLNRTRSAGCGCH